MSDAEVQADALGVTDMQVAVRLRRKAGVDARIFLFSDVCGDNVADEIGRRGGRRILIVRIANVSAGRLTNGRRLVQSTEMEGQPRNTQITRKGKNRFQILFVYLACFAVSLRT
jgi:hypothetical protein